MDLKIRNILPALTALILSSACFAAAEQMMEMQEPQDDMMMGANTANAPSARPHWMDVNGKMNVDTGAIFDIELLIWQAHADDLEVGVTNQDVSNSFTNPTAASDFKASRFLDGTYEHMEFDWDTGIRVGLGYYFDHDNWDICAAWTYFHDSAHKEIHANIVPLETFFPFWSSALVIIDPALAGSTGNLTDSHVEAHWKLKLNLIDLEIGRQFFAGRWLTLRPNVGLRAGWIYQTFQIEYARLSDGPIAPESKARNNFRGIGPIAGVDTEWHFGSSGVSLYADGAISLLYGRYHLSALESDEFISFSTPSNILMDTDERFNDAKAITDLAIGFSWQPDLSCYCRDFRLTLSAGWEHHLFFNQLQFKRISTLNFDEPSPQQRVLSPSWTEYVREAADLSTQGVTVTVRFEF